MSDCVRKLKLKQKCLHLEGKIKRTTKEYKSQKKSQLLVTEVAMERKIAQDNKGVCS